MTEQVDKRAIIRIICAIVGGTVFVVAAFVFGFVDANYDYERVPGKSWFDYSSRRVWRGYDLLDFFKAVFAFYVGAWLGNKFGDEISSEVLKK